MQGLFDEAANRSRIGFQSAGIEHAACILRGIFRVLIVQSSSPVRPRKAHLQDVSGFCIFSQWQCSPWPQARSVRRARCKRQRYAGLPAESSVHRPTVGVHSRKNTFPRHPGSERIRTWRESAATTAGKKSMSSAEEQFWGCSNFPQCRGLRSMMQ